MGSLNPYVWLSTGNTEPMRAHLDQGPVWIPEMIDSEVTRWSQRAFLFSSLSSWIADDIGMKAQWIKAVVLSCLCRAETINTPSALFLVTCTPVFYVYILNCLLVNNYNFQYILIGPIFVLSVSFLDVVCRSLLILFLYKCILNQCTL